MAFDYFTCVFCCCCFHSFCVCHFYIYIWLVVGIDIFGWFWISFYIQFNRIFEVFRFTQRSKEMHSSIKMNIHNLISGKNWFSILPRGRFVGSSRSSEWHLVCFGEVFNYKMIICMQINRDCHKILIKSFKKNNSN